MMWNARSGGRLESEAITMSKARVSKHIAVMVLVAASCGGDSNTVTTASDGAATTISVTSTASDRAATTTSVTTTDTGDTLESNLTLARRPGSKPNVTSGVPHIQLDQTSSDGMIEKLSTRAFSLDGVLEQPSQASLPGAIALTLSPELAARSEAVIVGREFGHIHARPNGGGSLHLRLPTDQANEVVNTGWGEWHPFALDGSVPNLLMIYAPRDDDDLAVVMTIIEAAVA